MVPLAMQRRSLRVRLRSTVRRLAPLVSAKTLGCDPADPLALAACLQTTVSPQHFGDSCTTSTCTSSIRAVVVLVSSKAAERSCPARRSLRCNNASGGTTTHLGFTRSHHQVGHFGLFHPIAEVVSREVFGIQLATSTSSSCRLSRVSWPATSSCQRILRRGLEEVLTRSRRVSPCTAQGRSGTCPTSSSSVTREQHRVHPMQWPQLQSAHEQVFFSAETRPPQRPQRQLTKQMCVDEVGVVSEGWVSAQRQSCCSACEPA